jgi:hypothetical protein
MGRIEATAAEMAGSRAVFTADSGGEPVTATFGTDAAASLTVPADCTASSCPEVSARLGLFQLFGRRDPQRLRPVEAVHHLGVFLLPGVSSPARASS